MRILFKQLSQISSFHLCLVRLLTDADQCECWVLGAMDLSVPAAMLRTTQGETAVPRFNCWAPASCSTGLEQEVRVDQARSLFSRSLHPRWGTSPIKRRLWCTCEESQRRLRGHRTEVGRPLQTRRHCNGTWRQGFQYRKGQEGLPPRLRGRREMEAVQEIMRSCCWGSCGTWSWVVTARKGPGHPRKGLDFPVKATGNRSCIPR